MKIKKSISYRIFMFFNVLILLGVVVVTVYPFLNIIALSFSSEENILAGLVNLIPQGFNTRAYEQVFALPMFARGYMNTLYYTVTTIVVCLFMTTICAYPLSKRYLPGRNFFVKLIMFTMFFGGGLIPNFLLIKALGFYNTTLAIVVPGAIATWNVMIMMTFFSGIPEALEDAAQIDGLGPLGTLWYIVLPLSKPIMATMVLFFGVGAWNNWFGPFIYLQDNNKFPITLFLRNILMAAQSLNPNDIHIDASGMQVQRPAESLKSAAIILVSTPILVLYPFVQKYFVKGVLIGSVK